MVEYKEFKGKRILVVEDWQGLREGYASKLGEFGFDVTAVANFRDGKEKLSSQNFHIAWIDLKLDERDTSLSGFDLVRAINQADEGTQILIVTDYDDYKTALKSVQEMGAHGFLGKKHLSVDNFESCVEELKLRIANCTVDDQITLEEVKKAVLGSDEKSIASSEIASKLSVPVDRLFKALTTGCDFLKPIRSLKGEKVAFRWNDQREAYVALLWSKKWGRSVEFVLASKPPKGGNPASALYRREKPLYVSIEPVQEARSRFG